MIPRTVLVALASALLAGLLVAQDRLLELRDSSGRLLRGVPLTVAGADGRQHELRTSLDGRLVVPGELRARKLESAEFTGARIDLDPDARAQLANEIDQRRLPGMRSPSNANIVIARVRDILNAISLETLEAEWSVLRGRLNRAGITQDRFDAVDRSIADTMTARARALATLGEPAMIPAADALSRLEEVEAIVTGWKSVRNSLGEVTNLALLQPGSDEARRTQLLTNRHLGEGDSSLEARVRNLAFAVDTPIASLTVDDDASSLDGFGLGRLEIQVRLEAWVAGESGGPPVRSSAPAPESGMRIEFQSEGCSVEPDVAVIPAGRSGTSMFVSADAGSGAARVVASAAGLADAELLIDVVFPWRSLVGLIVGLMAGALLRTRLARGEAGADAGRGPLVVNAVAGFALLAAWFASYVAFVAPHAAVIDPRAGVWTQVLTAAICALIGLPLLSGWVKRWLRGS